MLQLYGLTLDPLCYDHRSAAMASHIKQALCILDAHQIQFMSSTSLKALTNLSSCFWQLNMTSGSVCRAAAAVEVVTRELKMRTNNINAPRPADNGVGRGTKRKRTQAPEETCPYCTHVYTVRDGLSNKPDMEGNRQVYECFFRLDLHAADSQTMHTVGIGSAWSPKPVNACCLSRICMALIASQWMLHLRVYKSNITPKGLGEVRALCCLCPSAQGSIAHTQSCFLQLCLSWALNLEPHSVCARLCADLFQLSCRLHLRKCQCREKTPPCRNCPLCKENSDIMALNDPNLQFQLCQVRFKCDICACR